MDERAVIAEAFGEDMALDLATGPLTNGAFGAGAEGRALPIEERATGRSPGEAADASEADSMEALEAAVAAHLSWARSATRERVRILRRAADLRDQAETLAGILTAETGRPVSESRAAVEFAADCVEFAEEALRVAERIWASPDGESRHSAVSSPLGPCLIVTPWNSPLAVPVRGIGPAIAAGCAVVLRPSSLSPLSALGLGEMGHWGPGRSGGPEGIAEYLVIRHLTMRVGRGAS
jgi:succinate-semialdehyde dehydrogenase/glutarate-semialdehyde dehydrogenase